MAENPHPLFHNTLSTVNVTTAAGGGRLSLDGLKDPKAFKEKVWEMKRAGASGVQAAHAAAMATGGEAPTQQAMGGGFAVTPWSIGWSIGVC